MPYVTVLPITGNKWKTRGGSLGFMNRNCLRTLRTMARRIKEAKPAATTTGVDELEVKSPTGPVTVAKTPMVDVQQEATREAKGAWSGNVEGDAPS